MFFYIIESAIWLPRMGREVTYNRTLKQNMLFFLQSIKILKYWKTSLSTRIKLSRLKLYQETVAYYMLLLDQYFCNSWCLKVLTILEIFSHDQGMCFVRLRLIAKSSSGKNSNKKIPGIHTSIVFSKHGVKSGSSVCQVRFTSCKKNI